MKKAHYFSLFRKVLMDCRALDAFLAQFFPKGVSQALQGELAKSICRQVMGFFRILRARNFWIPAPAVDPWYFPGLGFRLH